MKYPDKLIVIPLETKVLLPSVVFRLSIRGKQATELTKDYFTSLDKKPTIYIACIPLKSSSNKVSHHDESAISSQAPFMPNATSEIQQGGDNSGVLLSQHERDRCMDYGCLGRILGVQKSGVHQFNLCVEGLARFKVVSWLQETHGWMAQVEYIHVDAVTAYPAVEEEFKMLCRQFVDKMRALQVPESLVSQFTKIVATLHVSPLADMVVSLIETTFSERLEMLSTPALEERLALAIRYLRKQLEVLQVSNKMSTMDSNLSKRQREFYLRQQVCKQVLLFLKKIKTVYTYMI